MKPCLCQLVNSGVHPDTPSRKAGYIRASNTTALVIGLWLLSIMAISTPILIDVWGWYTAANILVSLICLLVVTFNALHLGRDPWDHLFLLAMVLIAFQYMESRKVIVGTLVGPTLMQRPAPP